MQLAKKQQLMLLLLLTIMKRRRTNKLMANFSGDGKMVEIDSEYEEIDASEYEEVDDAEVVIDEAQVEEDAETLLEHKGVEAPPEASSKPDTKAPPNYISVLTGISDKEIQTKAIILMEVYHEMSQRSRDPDAKQALFNVNFDNYKRLGEDFKNIMDDTSKPLKDRRLLRTTYNKFVQLQLKGMKHDGEELSIIEELPKPPPRVQPERKVKRKAPSKAAAAKHKTPNKPATAKHKTPSKAGARRAPTEVKFSQLAVPALPGDLPPAPEDLFNF